MVTVLCVQITSYGGHLRYTVNYVAGFDRTPTEYPDVEILVWMSHYSLLSDREQTSLFKFYFYVVIARFIFVFIRQKRRHSEKQFTTKKTKNDT